MASHSTPADRHVSTLQVSSKAPNAELNTQTPSIMSTPRGSQSAPLRIATHIRPHLPTGLRPSPRSAADPGSAQRTPREGMSTRTVITGVGHLSFRDASNDPSLIVSAGPSSSVVPVSKQSDDFVRAGPPNSPAMGRANTKAGSYQSVDVEAFSTSAEKSAIATNPSSLQKDESKKFKSPRGMEPRPPMVAKPVTDAPPGSQKNPLPPIDLNKLAAMADQLGSSRTTANQSQQEGTSRKNRTERNLQNMTFRADGAWGHDASKASLKHLIQDSSCTCNGGEKITYIAERRKKDELDERVPSPEVGGSNMESLIPEEYYVVRHHIVCPVHDDSHPYKITLRGNVWTEVLFPALRPTSRDQVRYLEKTMDQMVHKISSEIQQFEQSIETEKSKVHSNPDSHFEYDSSPLVDGFLSLVEKEQRIFNTVFHELVRQVTVECYERGVLLSKIRQLYAELLSRIPKQVMFMYEELLAQRANSRRLMKELQICKEDCSRIREENLQLRRNVDDLTNSCTKQEESLHILEDNLRRQQDTFKDYLDLNQLQRARLEQELLRLREEKRSWFYNLEKNQGTVQVKITLPDLKDKESRLYKIATELSNVISDMNRQRLRYFATSHETFKSMLVQYSIEFIDSLSSVRDKLIVFNEESGEMRARVASGDQMASSLVRYSTIRWKDVINEQSAQLVKHEHDARRGLMNLKDLVENWFDSVNDMGARVVDLTEKSNIIQSAKAIKDKADVWLQHPMFHLAGRFKDPFSFLLNNMSTWIDRFAVGKEKSWPEFLYPSEAVNLKENIERWDFQSSALINAFQDILGNDPKLELDRLSRMMDGSRLHIWDIISKEATAVEIEAASIHGRLEAWTERVGNTRGSEMTGLVADLESMRGDVMKWVELMTTMCQGRQDAQLVQGEFKDFLKEMMVWVDEAMSYARLVESNPDDPKLNAFN